MTDGIKRAFDCIHAEEKLKSDIKVYLQKELSKKRRVNFPVTRYAAALAAIFVLVVSGVYFTHGLYFTPEAYVDVDVNPSIELTINRFDRVIGAFAYNSEGEDIIKEISLRHRSYNDALYKLMEAMEARGFLENGELISVTLQTDDTERELTLLGGIQTGIEGYMSLHHSSVQIDVFPVSGGTRSDSHELGVSPAKYLAIQELIEVDPTATVESCRGHTISEIKELTQGHGAHHGNGAGASGGGGGGDTASASGGEDGTDFAEQEDSKESEVPKNGHNGGGHHGRGHG